MSGQSNLTNWEPEAWESESATEQADGAAKTSNSAGTRWTDWSNYQNNTSSSECKNCGAEVDPEIGRVVGDRDNDLVRCADCHGSTGGQAQKLNTASHVSKMREERSDVKLDRRLP